MSQNSAKTAKSALRAQVRERRLTRSASERAEAARGLGAHIGALIADQKIRTIAAFIPVDTEPPITRILDDLSRSGIQVLLPVSRPNRTMDWAVHAPGSEFATDELGMPAPHGDPIHSDELNDLDLVLCPAALVDRRGYRLGWGLGYYDRFLASLTHRPRVLAVVFDDEIVESLPHEEHDHPVDGVVTPAGLRWF